MMNGPALITSVLLLQAAPASAPPPSVHVLTLNEAVQTAAQNQPQLRIAHAQTDAAMARADESRAPLLPQVNAIGSFRLGTNNVVAQPTQVGSGIAPPAPSFSTTPFWNFGISASQLIYDFGQTTGRWRASQRNAEGQQQNERTTRLLTILSVRTAYFQARAQKSNIAVARDTLENQQRHLAQIQGFVEVGTRPEIDLAQARTDVANAKVQLIGAEGAYGTAKAQLNQAMGIVPSVDYDVSDEAIPAIPEEDQASDVLVQSAVAARPELVALGKQIEAQEQLVRSARGNYAPSLGASTGFTEAGKQLDNMVWNWNAQVTLNWQLFQGMLVPAQVREAEANLAAAKSNRDLALTQLRLEVEQDRLAVRTAKVTIDAAEEALVNAKTRLRLAEGRYQTGAGSVIELQDAQIALTNAAGQRIGADYNLAAARAQLLKALGRE